MKKKNLLFTIVASLLLVGCSSVTAEPSNVDDAIVSFENTTENYYANEYQTIYDKLVSSGTSNSTIVNEVLYQMALNEIGDIDADTDEVAAKGFTTKEHIQKLIKKAMVDKVKGGSYNVNGLFQEEKFAMDLRGTLYNIPTPDAGFNNDYSIKVDDDYEDIFKADYSDYINRSIKKDIYRKLLTAKYLYDKKYTVLGKSYTREVQYIALQNISTNKAAAVNTLNSYLKTYLLNGASVEECNPSNFDLDSLARIWKGVPDDLSASENQFIEDNNLYTLSDQIADEIKKIVKTSGDEIVTDEEGNYTLLPLEDLDTSIVSKYTNDSYPVAWGHTLALRSLEQKDIVEEDLYSKSAGISNLPSTITQRIFSAAVTNTFSQVIGTGDNSIRLLLPESTENGSLLDPARYIHYDSDSSTYYVVVLKNIYTSTRLKVDDDASDEVKAKIKEAAVNVAEALAKTSTYTTDAIVYYFKNSGVKYHDDDFYDYLKSTYPDIFDSSK